MHANPDPTAVLALWERALGLPATARDAALLEVMGGAAPRTLGERNVVMLRLHARLFGRALALRSHCPECGAAAGFESDCVALAAGLPVAGAAPPYVLETDAHRIEFRLPTAADVAAAAASAAGDEFALRLLDLCVLDCRRGDTRVAVPDLPDRVLESLSSRIEALDPGAALSFVVECPQCAVRWNASFDAGLALWEKIRAAAERVMLEVDALARAYGWTEREVLELSALRRAAYLQLAA